PLIGRPEIRSPEPDRQGKFGVVKNGPGREGDLVTTAGTAPTSVRPHRVGTWMSTSRTVEPLRPAARRQILLAGVLSGELTLKFAQIRRKWRARHGRTLQLVVCLKKRVNKGGVQKILGVKFRKFEHVLEPRAW